jgi:hypothetical protein
MSASLKHDARLSVPERIATWAAGTGFGLSALLLLVYRAAANGAWGGIEFRSALEAAFVLVWPSSILMKGAQSSQGGAILFLFSAALNAAYFAFVSLSAYLLYGKFETLFDSGAAGNAVPLRVYSAPRLMRRASSANPLS